MKKKKTIQKHIKGYSGHLCQLKFRCLSIWRGFVSREGKMFLFKNLRGLNYLTLFVLLKSSVRKQLNMYNFIIYIIYNYFLNLYVRIFVFVELSLEARRGYLVPQTKVTSAYELSFSVNLSSTYS